MFTVDGVAWSIPCDIERVSEVTASEISGLMLDGSYFNDVIGTYLKYTVKLAVPMNMRDQYNALYEIISNPVDGHSFVFPYGSGTVTVTGRVSSISDVYVRMAGGGVYWKGIKFDVTSNAPVKQLSLSTILTRGRAPLPEVAEPEAGDLYRAKTNGTWEQVDYDNADNISY